MRNFQKICAPAFAKAGARCICGYEITYNVLDEHYDTDIFTEPTIKGKLGTNAMKAQRHL